jgi:hypothetical protein
MHAGDNAMNARAKNGNREEFANEPATPFCLQSTLNDYEVEEVSMQQLATLLAQAHSGTSDPDLPSAVAAGAH